MLLCIQLKFTGLIILRRNVSSFCPKFVDKYVKEELNKTQRIVPDWKSEWVLEQLQENTFIVSNDSLNPQRLDITQSQFNLSGVSRTTRAISRRQSAKMLRARAGRALRPNF
jgi:hypothetical protein